MSAEFIILTKEEYTVGCGMGQGAQCCRFLVAGAEGFQCARFTVFHDQLVARGATMVAQRTPVAPYPHCQLERQPHGVCRSFLCDKPAISEANSNCEDHQPKD